MNSRFFGRQLAHGPECLEQRIAPATLVSPTTVTFDDIDGDFVTVKITKGTFAANLAEFTLAPLGSGEVLQMIDLRDAKFAGTNLSITAQPKNGAGNGFVNVGFIQSEGRDLGAVLIDGDLGRILCGDAVFLKSPGLKSLAVESLGELGILTQNGGNLTSHVEGSVGKLGVKTNLRDAVFSVGAAGAPVSGTLGPVTIGGDLIGGADADSGVIRSSGAMGLVKIGGNLRGGAGPDSGQIVSGGDLLGVTIGQSILGLGDSSARIESGGDIGKINVRIDAIGGNTNSASIDAAGSIAAVTFGGSLLANPFTVAAGSASVIADGKIGPVKIGHDVSGGPGQGSGRIFAEIEIGSVTLGGSLFGGGGDLSGTITADDVGIGSVKISGSISGGGGENSGAIIGASIRSVLVNGSITGNSGPTSGILRGNEISSVKVLGSVTGGDGDDSGAIKGNMLGAVSIGGSLEGGDGQSSGKIEGNTIRTLKITGSILGGDGPQSGQVIATSLGKTTIDGSLEGGTAPGSGSILSKTIVSISIRRDIIGTDADETGLIHADTSIGPITLGRSLQGGNASKTGAITSGGSIGLVKVGGDISGGNAPDDSTVAITGAIISASRIAGVTVGKDMRAGSVGVNATLEASGAIRAGDDLGAVTIKGNIIGNSTHAVTIFARGQVGATRADLAIKSLTVTGDVSFAQILAGYDQLGVAKNADAQIGKVLVGGDWTASTLAAGVDPLDGAFGNPGDARIDELAATGQAENAAITSRIAAILIKGTLSGTDALGDFYGFGAEQIGSFKAGVFAAKLDPTDTDVINFAFVFTTDVALREI